jgi:hypothetical protein
MRLNESNRNAFVVGVLSDTPHIDYNKQAQKIIQDHFLSIAPKEIIAIYNSKKLREYLPLRRTTWSNSPWGSFSAYCVPSENDWHAYEIKDEPILSALLEIGAAHRAQKESRNALESKLRATILGFNTVKQARAALPEFAKYLPDPEVKSSPFLPAVNDLVTDLMKAGWPDHKKNAASTTTTQGA